MDEVVGREAVLQDAQALHDVKRCFVDFPADLDKNRRCYEKAGFRDTGARREVEPGLVLAAYQK